LSYYILLPRPPRARLFPYTTLFRSFGAPRNRRGTGPGASLPGGISTRGVELAVGPVRDRDRRLRSSGGAGCGHRIEATFWNSSRSEEHTSELQSRENLVCRLLLEKK